MNKGLSEELYCMVSPTFQNVGKKSFCLSDLSVTGYDKSEINPDARPRARWEGGCLGGAFELNVFKNDGNPDNSLYGGGMYFWVDATTGFADNPTPYPAGWYTFDADQNKYVKIPDEEIAKLTFDLGQAFWVSGGTKKLVTSGEVSKKDLEVKTNDELYTAIGNGMPVDMTLGDLSVTGYDKSEINPDARPRARWEGGCIGGQFELNILKNDGNVDDSVFGGGMYFWVDAITGFTDKPTTYPAGWYLFDADQNKYVAMSAEDMAKVAIPAGQGLWVSGPKMRLVIPSPLADHEEK